MMTGGRSKLTYCLLKHDNALIEICPGIFDSEYCQFYIRYHEPTHVKYLKITVLSKLVDPESDTDIVAEFSECGQYMDVELGHLSLRVLTRIA